MIRRARGAILTIGAGALVLAVSKTRVARPNTTDKGISSQEQASTSPAAADTTFIGGSAVAEFLGVPLDRLAEAASQPKCWRLDDVLIATVADPVDSHLDWLWDSQFEAIRRAFEQSGYVADRFVLPDPDLSFPSHERLRIDLPSALRDKPGLILFRRVSSDTNGFALVYLVGETPTSGVQKSALLRALRERARLLMLLGNCAGRGDTLRIIGPTFSGSAPSLMLALQRAAGVRQSTITSARHDPSDSMPSRLVVDRVVNLISGTATAYGVKRLSQDSTNPNVRFMYQAAIHPDVSLLAVLYEHILPRLGMKRERLAILTESSTGYGQTTLEGTPPPTKHDKTEALGIPFPAGLSRVRRLYEATPELQGNAKRAINLAERARPSLNTADPPRALEDLPSTTLLTPAAVDAMVDQIAGVLLERRIRVIAIVATDVRDKLFIMNELRRRIGDVQFVVFGANVLLQRTDWNASMHGALVLSTYPLAEPVAIDSSGRRRTAFSSDEAAGMYNATLLHLGRGNDLIGYSPGHVQPSVWATVIGRGQFYRLAAYSDSVFAPCYVHAKSPGMRCVAVRPTRPAIATRQLTLIYSPERQRFERPSLALMIAAASLALGVIWWIRRFRKRVPPAFATDEKLRGDAGAGDDSWLILQARSFVIVAAMAVIASAAPALVLIAPQRVRDWAPYVVLSALIPLIIGYLWASWRRRSLLWFAADIRRLDFYRSITHLSTKELGWVEILGRGLLLLVGVGAGVVGLWYAWVVVRSDPVQIHRFNDVGSFVSPILPLLLAGSGLTFLCLWELARVQGLLMATPLERALQAATPPCPPGWSAQFPVSVVVDRAGMLREDLLLLLRRKPAGVGRPDTSGLGLSAVVPMVGLVLYLWLGPFLTFEPVAGEGSGGTTFSFLLWGAILSLLLVGAWAALRLVDVWGSTQALLDAIKATELAPAIKELAKTRPSHHWLGFTEATDAAPSYSPRLLVEFVSKAPPAAGLSAPPAPSQQGPSQEGRKQAVIGAFCALVNPAFAGDGAWLATARNYLAEEFCLYLEWMEQHLRNFVYLIAGALIAGPLLLNAYPFYPQHRARIAFAVLFAGALFAILLVVVRQNRDELLSAINGTTPGKLTLDSGFVRIVVIAILLPLLSFVLSEAPTVQNALLSWATPLLQQFVQ